MVQAFAIATLILFIVNLVVLLILIAINSKEGEFGAWFGGKFIINPILPRVSDSTEPKETSRLERHNKMVFWFWMNFSLVFLSVTLFNL